MKKLIGLLFLLPCSVIAQNLPDLAELEENRDKYVEWLASAPPGVDFYATSVPLEGGADTTIALLIDGLDPEEAAAQLYGADAWCEIVFLHLNVKSCTHRESDGQRWMKMYMGRKYYQHPKKAKQIEVSFDSGTTEDGILWVSLTADEGPYNTRDYVVSLVAIPSENGMYAQFRSAAMTGKAIAGAMDLYFATLARSKIGFSIVGTDKDGNPEYSGGTLAMLERNVVRYLIALDAYMHTYDSAGDNPMLERAEMWFDATERFPEQLHEVERENYLRDKAKEYAHQRELQAEAESVSK